MRTGLLIAAVVGLMLGLVGVWADGERRHTAAMQEIESLKARLLQFTAREEQNSSRLDAANRQLADIRRAMEQAVKDAAEARARSERELGDLVAAARQESEATRRELEKTLAETAGVRAERDRFRRELEDSRRELERVRSEMAALESYSTRQAEENEKRLKALRAVTEGGIPVQAVVTREPPPPLAGRVLLVNDEAQTIVVNLGRHDGVSASQAFTVQRGDSVVGRGIVTKIDDEWSVVRLDPASVKGKPKPGDMVTSGPAGGGGGDAEGGDKGGEKRAGGGEGQEGPGAK